MGSKCKIHTANKDFLTSLCTVNFKRDCQEDLLVCGRADLRDIGRGGVQCNQLSQVRVRFLKMAMNNHVPLTGQNS
jgi:hypothetical protein